MKKIFSLLAALTVAVSTIWADSPETLAFSSNNNGITIVKAGAGEPGGDIELTKGVITVTSAGGQAQANKPLQIYKTKSMTVAVPNGYNITSIAFTYPTGCYPFSEAIPSGLNNATTKTASGKTAATFTPSTPASSFTFTNVAGGQTKVNTMVVTYSAAGPVDPTINTTDKSVEVDKLFDVSTMFTSNSTGSITYSVTAAPTGANYDLDGADFLATTLGEYTIQASQAAVSGKYNSATATAVLTVIAVQTKYHINCTAPIGGSYTVQVGEQSAETVTEAKVFEAAENQIITLTTTANPGYKLASTPFVVKKVSDQTEVNVSKDGDNYIFEMPAEEVTITANYSKTYTITAGSCSNGAITKIADKDGNAITETSQNSKVVVTTTPAAGYELDELYFIKEGESSHNDFKDKGYFSMVASNVTVYATFKEITMGLEDYSITFVETGTSEDGGNSYDKSAVQNVIATNVGKVSTISALSGVNPGATGRGAKFGSGKSKGSITIDFANAISPQAIIFSAAMYGTDEGADGFTVTFNSESTGTQLTLSAGKQTFEDKVITLGGTKSISKITIANSGENKRFYLKKIAFTVPSIDVVISSAEYATYYNESSAYIMPEGLEGITVEGVSNEGILTLKTRYHEGDVVPAGEALILHGAAKTYTLREGASSQTKIEENILKGTSYAEEETTGGDKFYRLSQHEGQVGFYYGAEDGAAFQPGANKAYLAVSGTNAPARFIFGQQDVPTELHNVSAEAVSRKVMIDGRLYILRDGNMFDLNGRLVK